MTRSVSSFARRVSATFTVLAAAALATAMISSQSTAATAWAPAATAQIHPGTMMYTAGAQCTAQLRLHRRRRQHLRRLRRPLRRHRLVDRHQRLPDRLRAARHQGRLHQRRQPGQRGHDRRPRHARLQLVGHRAPAGHDRRQHLRLQRPRPGQGRRRRRRPRSTRACPFWGGPTGIDTDGTAAGDRVWTYGNSSLRGRTVAAVAAHRHQPRRRRRRRRLEPPAVHR